MTTTLSKEELFQKMKALRQELEKTTPKVRAWRIKDELAKEGIAVEEMEIRAMFLEAGEPFDRSTVSPTTTPETPETEAPKPERKAFNESASPKTFQTPDEFKTFIPKLENLSWYVVRDVDKRLAIHYNSGKNPLTQGPQGTGKSAAHEYYAGMNTLPFFVVPVTPDFNLPMLFGTKTIKNGSVVFQEGLFVKMIQMPSVILFDEINAANNAATYAFHTFLQNRSLFIHEADDGKGRVYTVHPECRLGFAQNPKSAKYIGGNVKGSNFLGRLTYISYPPFEMKDMQTAITKRYPALPKDQVKNFALYYKSCTEIINQGNLAVDISIRQINNVIDLYLAGMSLPQAIEDGLASLLDAVSQPAAKDSFLKGAAMIWKELMK